MSDGAGWAIEADYGWADERKAFCVFFVEATSPEAVLDKMVGGCRTGILSVAEARTWVSEQTVPLYGSAVEAGIVGGWVVTFEANGYQATLPEVVRIRRISEGSRAVAVFRRVDGQSGFLYAVDGVVVRSFDPVGYGNPAAGDGPPLPEESGLDFADRHPMASAFACAERLTRVRLSADLLDEHGDWLAIAHHPLHSLTTAASCKADDFDGAKEAGVPSAGQSRTRGDWILGAIALLYVAGVRACAGDVEPGSDAPSPIQAVAVAPALGPKGTTIEITGGPCPAVPEGKQPFGISFRLIDPRPEGGEENPAGSAPLIPGKPWKGQLRIPYGFSVGRYYVYAACSATEAEGTEGSPFYMYRNGTFDVVEP